MPLRQLATIAFAVREAIEAADRTNWPAFDHFPRGTCGTVSEVLARLLRERFGLDARYVAGDGHPDCDGSHAWVEVDGTVIDITADQFGLPPVIVTDDSPWHAAWDRDTGRPPCLPDGWPMYPFALWEIACQALGFARKGHP